MGQLAAYIPELITAGGYAGAGALSSAFAPSPYQPRQSYQGQNAPEATLGEAGRNLEDVFSAFKDNASQPVTLPDAVVQPMHSRSGGDLPFELGHFNDPGTLSAPPSLPGLKFPSHAQNTGGVTPPDVRVPVSDTLQYGLDQPQPDQQQMQNPQTPLAGPVRQRFGASNNPSAIDRPAPSDPRLAAIELLRSAAMAA